MSGISDFLYSTPSFVSGAASIGDMFGTLLQFNESNSPAQADFFAIREDWRAVGKALSDALPSISPEMKRAEATNKRPR